MKKIASLYMTAFVFLTGCSMYQPITTQVTDNLTTMIKEQYAFVETATINSNQLGETLSITYRSSQEVEQTQLEQCFEETREWLLEDNHLEMIEEEQEQSYTTLVITIDTANQRYSYKSEQGKLEDDTDEYFDKWQQEILEKVDE